MSELPKIVRQRLAAVRAQGAHPDADLLCALAEQRLSGAEREGVLAHLAQCAECRETAALAAPRKEPTQTVVRPVRRRSWLPGALRWGALAASVVVVAAAVWLYRPQQRSSSTTMTTARSAAPSAQAPAATEAANAALRDDQAQAGKKLAEPAPVPKSARQKSPLKTESAEAKRDKDQARPGREAEVPAGMLAKAAPAAAAPVSPPPLAAPAEKNAAVAPSTAAQNMAVPSSPSAQDKLTERRAESRPQPPSEPLQSQSTGRLSADWTAAETVQVESAAPALRTKPAMKGTPAQWSLSSEGQVQVSRDRGASWKKLQIAKGVRFLAVSAEGDHVWAGGSGGALYHSADAGKSWAKVAVGTDEDIVKIEFQDAQHGVLTTNSGAQWTTDDGGKSWRAKD